MPKGRLYLLFLSETSLLRALWLALTGARICLVDMPPAIPALPILRWGRWLLLRFGAVRPILDFDDRLGELKELRVPRHHEDPFVAIEPWTDSYLANQQLDAILGDDADPYRQISCNYMFGYFDRLFFLNWFCQTYPSESATVVGADEVLLGMYEHVYGQACSLAVSRTRTGRGLFNPLLTALAFAALVWESLKGLRLTATVPRPVLLGSDCSGDDRDPIVWREVLQAGADVVVVFRSRQQKIESQGKIAPIPALAPGDGGFTPLLAWREFVASSRRLWRIARQARSLTPGHYHRLTLIPHKRLQIRKLFTLYRFRHFWTRDDYNVEHILRSQELRRMGGVSLGVQHGLPISAALIPQWRYVDCDLYYVFGLGIMRHYGDRWPKTMQARACGSLGMTREREARLADPRPNDIIFQAKAERTAQPLIDVLDSLVANFPDRTIYVQIKNAFSHTFLAQEVLSAAARYPNVVCTREKIYDLFLKARYLVTDPSTIGAEAIQFGLYAFMLDYDGRKSLYFRDFPDFCMSDPHEPARRIKAIEAGTYRYRFEDYELLIARHGRIYDQVRADIGLPPFLAPTPEPIIQSKDS